jgi:hypothetical protein
VGNWERGETVPRNRLTTLQDLLGPLDSTPASANATRHVTTTPRAIDSDEPSLRGASDAELLAEVARRFNRPAIVEAPHPASAARAEPAGGGPWHSRDARQVAHAEEVKRDVVSG